MSHYKPYPAYKDSGVEWIGRVPEHWDVKPICRVASYNDDLLPEKNVQPDQVLRYVDISSVNHMDGITDVAELRFADAPSRARRRAKTGDVVISTVRTYLKAVATVTGTHADCIYSTGFAVLRARPSEVEPEFLKWMTLNDLVIQAIEAHSEGLSYPAINATELVKLKAVIPPPAEQTAIAAALDRETARIDALIAKKTRFIELLKEKRQALITHAVTKGLSGLRHSHESGNPESPATGPKALDSRMRGNDEGGRASGDDSMAVPMKDSGVEWIGEVPEHWTLGRLRDFVRTISTGPFGTALGSDDYVSNGVPVINPSHIVDSGCVPDATVTVNEDKASQLAFWAMRPGDIVTARRGELGRAAIISEQQAGWICGTGSIRITPDAAKIASEYVHTTLQADYARRWLELHSVGSTMPNLSEKLIGDLPMAVPPTIPEQHHLLRRSTEGSIRLDAMAAKVKHSIILLKERRSALITAAVTGQIDLRDAALPGKDTSA